MILLPKMRCLILSLAILLVTLSACRKEEEVDSIKEGKSLIKAVDASSIPEILTFNNEYYDFDGQKRDFLKIVKENGVNTIRLRVWVRPETKHSSFEEVKEFCEIIKNEGLKTWLTLHYSDTWADPSQQKLPEPWANLNINHLIDTVYQYTTTLVKDLRPAYIQIGNEINSGFLHPYGDIGKDLSSFITLIKAGCQAVKDYDQKTKIILHFAGLEGADWFYSQMKEVDYDVIGLSYYPIWHGKSLNLLSATLRDLGQNYTKETVVAETAYPFTLEWNDETHNVVGEEDQLILPDFPASLEGQRGFLNRIHSICQTTPSCIGFSYWGSELIAFKGNHSNQGSSWENQALFGFDNRALPALMEFRDE